MAARLPAHLEVAGLIRAAEAAGGFATVLKSGERDAGTILVVVTHRHETSLLYERMPNLDGDRRWERTRQQNTEKQHEFSEYLDRRGKQDPDCWIVELDVANGQQFIDSRGTDA